MRKPELLVPASSLEVLKTAVIFGADAVYIGGEASLPISWHTTGIWRALRNISGN